MRRLKQRRTYELALSKAGLGPVAGVDEAGRGACCGPITIAACIMPDRPIKELAELSDSKKLTPRQRERLFPLIKDKAVDWSVVHIGAGDIDKRGIQHANISGMRRAVARLEARPGYVLTDALFIPGLTQPHLPIIGGDAAAPGAGGRAPPGEPPGCTRHTSCATAATATWARACRRP